MSGFDAGDASAILISMGLPAGATVTPSISSACSRCALMISPARDEDDEIVPSRINVRVDPNGKILDGDFGDAVGDADECGVCNGKASTHTGASGAIAASVKLAATSERKLTRAFLALCFLSSCGALAFLDKLLDFLATFLSDSFVEVRAVAIARGFAALLSTFLSDLLVELMAVG